MIKRAQVVAEAVVKTRSSISLWACMGPRRRVSSHSDAKPEDLPETPLITETTSETVISEVIISTNSDMKNAEYCSSSDNGTGHDETDEEEEKAVEASTIDDEITEGELWYELEKQLQRQESEVNNEIQEEEEAVAGEIIEEEKEFISEVENHAVITPSEVSDNLHFYPPGRIMHIISVPSSEPGDQEHEGVAEERVGLYETQRELYNKLRLSRTMINDHYMPMYKKMMELLIKQLEEELDSDYVVS